MKIKDTNEALAILKGKADGWEAIFADARKVDKTVGAAKEKLTQAREAGSGTTGRFLAIAKGYPNIEQWAAAWAAMRMIDGHPKPPQVLSDAYSVIRRAMRAGICGVVLDADGKPIKPLNGPITQATSFNSLKSGLSAANRLVVKELSAEPGMVLLDRLAEIYKGANPETKNAMVSRLTDVLRDMLGAAPETVQVAAHADIQSASEAILPAARGSKKGSKKGQRAAA